MKNIILLIFSTGVLALYGCFFKFNSEKNNKNIGNHQFQTLNTNYSSNIKLQSSNTKVMHSDIKNIVYDMFKKNKDYVVLFSLFSYAQGYSDNGTICVLVKKDNTGTMFYFTPNSNKYNKQHDLSKTTITEFKKLLQKSVSLSDYKHPSFGGIKYEFVYALKHGTTDIQVVKTLKMLNPALGGEEAKDYLNIIDAFKKLLN